MPSFGRSSLMRLATCDQKLQETFHEVISRLPWTDEYSGITIEDCSVVCGHRTEEQQDLAIKRGTTTLTWPHSNHNVLPSLAVDVVPYHSQSPHIHWSDIDEMEAFSVLVHQCNSGLLWGGDWDEDGVRVDHDPDERFLDGPHFELKLGA